MKCWTSREDPTHPRVAMCPLLIFVTWDIKEILAWGEAEPRACVLLTLVSVEHSAPGIAHCCCCRPVFMTFITATAASAISRGGREHILLPTDLWPELDFFFLPFYSSSMHLFKKTKHDYYYYLSCSTWDREIYLFSCKPACSLPWFVGVNGHDFSVNSSGQIALLRLAGQPL